ncbi:MAG: rhodanese-like domain-containing protein [Sedimenticola sp.]
MSYQDIEASDAEALLQTEGLVVIDTRDVMSRSIGQLPNAKSATDSVIEQLVERRRKNPPVLVYCYHGNSSRNLCAFLSQLGLKQVYNLVGGWEAWQQRPVMERSTG